MAARGSMWIPEHAVLAGVLIARTEDALQKQTYYLYKIVIRYAGKMPADKTKVTAHWRKYAVRTKVVLRDKSVKQVSHLRYPGCDVTYEYYGVIIDKYVLGRVWCA